MSNTVFTRTTMVNPALPPVPGPNPDINSLAYSMTQAVQRIETLTKYVQQLNARIAVLEAK
jgi:hypothetical protein